MTLIVVIINGSGGSLDNKRPLVHSHDNTLHFHHIYLAFLVDEKSDSQR